MPPLEAPNFRPSNWSIFSAADAIREFGKRLRGARIEISGAVDNIIVDVMSVNLTKANDGEYEISGKVPTEGGSEGDSPFVTMKISAATRVKVLAISVVETTREPEEMSDEEARRAAAP